MNSEFKNGLGTAIRVRRAKDRLTKEKLSLMVGINRLTLRRIESGQANPTLDVLLKIADGLNVSLDTLISEAAQYARE